MNEQLLGLIVGRRRQEVIPVAERIELDPVWIEVKALGERLSLNLGQTKGLVTETDREIAMAMGELVKWINAKDVRACVWRHLGEMEREAGSEGLNRENVLGGLAARRLGYGVSEEEFADFMRDYALERMRGRDAVGYRWFRKYFENDPENHARLLKFCNLILSGDDEGMVTVKLLGLGDGGINDVAYPLHNLEISVAPSGEVKTNFSEELFMLDEALFGEITRPEHGEVVKFLKARFVQIVTMYMEKQDEFYEDRMGDLGKTYMGKDLYKFLVEDYLKRKLSDTAYRQFMRAFDYAGAAEVEALVEFDAIMERLVNQGSDFSLWRNEYHRKNHLEKLSSLRKVVLRELAQMGYDLETGSSGFMRRIVNEKGLRRKIRRLWERVLAETVKMVADDDLRRTFGKTKAKILDKVITRGLEGARGVVEYSEVSSFVL